MSGKYCFVNEVNIEESEEEKRQEDINDCGRHSTLQKS